MHSQKLRAARTHTTHEKVLVSQIISYVQYLEDKKGCKFLDDPDINGFSQISTGKDEEDYWEQTDVIRTNLRQYLNKLIFIVSRLKRCISDFE